jgi:hypothetical protein
MAIRVGRGAPSGHSASQPGQTQSRIRRAVNMTRRDGGWASYAALSARAGEARRNGRVVFHQANLRFRLPRNSDAATTASHPGHQCAQGPCAGWGHPETRKVEPALLSAVIPPVPAHRADVGRPVGYPFRQRRVLAERLSGARCRPQCWPIALPARHAIRWLHLAEFGDVGGGRDLGWTDYNDDSPATRTSVKNPGGVGRIQFCGVDGPWRCRGQDAPPRGTRSRPGVLKEC